MSVTNPSTDSRPWAWATVRGNERKPWLTPDPEVIEFASHLRERSARRTYDLGCGLGRHTILLARAGFDVWATDLSRDGLIHTDKWLQREHLRGYTHMADLIVSPFPSNFFDGVVAFNVVYHATQEMVAVCLHEVRRTMRRGAELLVTFNSVESDDFGRGLKIDDYTYTKVGGPEDGIPHYFVDQREVERLLGAFRIDKLEQRHEDTVDQGRPKHAAHWIAWATKL